MPTIATFNVNSVNARLANLVEWLGRAAPDVVCLQETKCTDDAFPAPALEAAGYRCATFGQKAYNGVAILARGPVEDVVRGLPGDAEDAQARWIEGTVGGVRIVSLYLPNGNPVGSDKFAYKLAWMERARVRAAALLEDDLPLVLAGDWNVIPEPIDARNPERWTGDALFQPQSRRAFRALLHLGLYDAFRSLHPEETGAYTFWDYQGGAFPADDGIRIDHLLLDAQAVDRLLACRVDKEPRGRPRASDHTPILVELAAA